MGVRHPSRYTLNGEAARERSAAFGIQRTDQAVQVFKLMSCTARPTPPQHLSSQTDVAPFYIQVFHVASSMSQRSPAEVSSRGLVSLTL